MPHYHAQTTDFTCGPSALMMALARLHADYTPSQTEEFAIWREANSVFMGDGHAGCGPHAMALAARARGCEVRLWLNNADDLFADWTRHKDHKQVMRLMLAHDRQRVEEDPAIMVRKQPISRAELADALDEGWQVVLMVSEGIEAHWVLLLEVLEEEAFICDPWIERDKGETAADARKRRLTPKDFRRMIRYGHEDAQAALLLKRSSA